MNSEDIKTLPAIVGPTGVGKTAAAVAMAQQFDAEIISVDSRQVYIGMDIATGKEVDQGSWAAVNGRRTLEIDGVLIHGLDLVEPDQPFSVSQWYRQVVTLLEEILFRQRKPILVGGTGYYLRALEGGIKTLEIPPNQELRARLESVSTDVLVEQLAELDADRVSLVDPSNKRRLIRAIEVAEHQHQQQSANERSVSSPDQKYQKWPDSFDLSLIGLTMDRRQLYDRIDGRVDRMVEMGLVDETRQLLEKYGREIPAMSGIGYAEIIEYLDGVVPLTEAVLKIKWRNHGYVRRQYTWFNKRSVHWINADNNEGWQKDLKSQLAKVFKTEIGST